MKLEIEMKTTQYFDYVRKRPDRVQIKEDWIKAVIENPERTETQSDGRIRKWGKILETGKYLRVSCLKTEKRFIMPSSIDHTGRSRT